MQPTENGSDSVKTTEVAFEIIGALRTKDGANITEIAETLGIAKSTAYRHLSTLQHLGYLVKENNEYHISLQFLDLGMYALHRKEAYALIKPKVKMLADETKERAQFKVEEHGETVYVHHETGENAVRIPDSKPGQSKPMHVTAAGKAILSAYPEAQRRKMVKQLDLTSWTENTITDSAELLDHLRKSEARGYSTNQQEGIENLCAVGVPVLGHDDMPIGALSVSGPSHRIKGDLFEQQLPDLLIGTAKELEMNIAFS